MPTGTPARLDLDTLRARREAVLVTVTEARSVLADRQDAALDGTPETMAAVTDAQARLSAAEGMVRLLDERIAVAEADAAASAAADAALGHRDTLRAAAADAERARETAENSLVNLVAALAVAAEATAAAEAEWTAANRRFLRAYKAIYTGESEAAAEAAVAAVEEAGTSLDAVLSEHLNFRFYHPVPSDRRISGPDLGPLTETAHRLVAEAVKVTLEEEALAARQEAA